MAVVHLKGAEFKSVVQFISYQDIYYRYEFVRKRLFLHSQVKTERKSVIVNYYES